MNTIKHYIRVDGEIIIDGFSDIFRKPLDTDICINKNGGRQFELLGEINPNMINEDGTHKFRYAEAITEEIIPIIEDVSDEVVVDTSGVKLDEGAVLEGVSTTATATGYKVIKHRNMVVRYATEQELADELSSFPEVVPEPTEMEKLQAQVDILQAQNDMLTECVLEMSSVVYGG